MRRWLAALLLALLLPARTPATTLLAMYLDDLTAQSQTVAYGTVIGSRVEWDASHNWIYTVYTVVPAQYLKGHLGASFELREPGGELDGMIMKVSGVPRFHAGQDAVFFVWTDPKGVHQVSGFEQGAVTILTDPVTGAKTASRAIPLGSARAAGAKSSTSRGLPQLLEAIRASAARSRQGVAGE
jgi:hypothetical protein